ncbi:MAG: DUF4395 family protein [Actinomycetota bacterium]
MTTRTADPYRDTDVIDARAPRFNQATIGTLAAVAVLADQPVLIGLLALQFIVGLRFGRRWCLPCVFYFEIIQPRVGEGEIEDARPPRFANILGAVFLSASTIAHIAGLEAMGWALAAIVAALALLAATTGLCVGCEIYKFIARARGIRPGRVDAIDLADLRTAHDGHIVVEFTHPLCTGCRELAEKLTQAGHRLVQIDVSKNPELARKYHVSVVPSAFAVGPTGLVEQRLA